MGKISGYGADTAPTSDDLIVTVDLTSGNNKKVALGSLRGLFASKRVTTTTSSSSPTPNTDTTDMYAVTALAANATVGAPTGTPSDGQVVTLRIKDNGTGGFTIGWNTIWRPIGVTLPTATVAGKVMYITAIYNAQDTFWDVVSIGRQS